ncbi:MAG TPA: DUF1343 domain-containing protein [Thermoanaerobaculia bacterium]|nr:DUF1343 domain-containing protein [Thermoanaerobaculia bacterium]
MRLGIDVLDPSTLTGRVALLTNYAAINRHGTRTVDVLLQHGVELVRLFAPEHGFWGDVAYLEGVAAEDYKGVPVESLYDIQSSASLAPAVEQLHDVETLVVDLQDVGARYYTYAATLGNCMAVAAQTRTRVVVLDRPNPLGGRAVEGNVNFAAPFLTFVGQYPLPIRHGLTLGEIAEYINTTQLPHCNLEVVKMKGWRRDMWWDETGLQWVHPSPNMATPDTAVVYPGTCLFEGTNLSEGRGTTHPFELIGAPWLDEHALAARLNDLGLPGVDFQPFVFKPTFNKHAGQRCHGVFIHVLDRDAFQPVRTAMILLKVMRDADPARFAWYDGFYEYATVLAIDALSGSAEYRTLVEMASLEELVQWIDAAEERRTLIEEARQRVMFAEYEEGTSRPVLAPAASRDLPSVLEFPRAEA